MRKHKLKEQWESILKDAPEKLDWWKQKQNDFDKRNIEVLQITGEGQVFQLITQERSKAEVTYLLHLLFLLKQEENIFIEEELLPFRAVLEGERIVSHEIMRAQKDVVDSEEAKFVPDLEDDSEGQRVMRPFVYDRRKAVQYAERWWNEYNPEYHHFEDDCTNFISQCLRAGGARMWGEPNRSRGWWYSGTNWSYSWSVSNALRWYLASANKGLTAIEVDKATDLLPGDIICYDFEGDGKWNHTTIVVAKDQYGEPLVNAHTHNSRHRNWKYEDSTAWTINCQYKFFRIGG
ncbi:amidase domain-containing protein [Salirhabdus sp. Marseille-P4669]|uniref:amidase domain-containing protein n=1 Tax=Salirhabdus sp. Marseille-P4669 TaxID=2042310 RepID=UPI000C7B6BED|nr:amidase domain-containing protein [Salirhabdus sp. Marseille-P4669]